jgi:crossover junction endodeoxyribonuclease RuvC
MRILGIDPGVARVGWGLIDENHGKPLCIKYGCVETTAGLKLEDRLESIHLFLEKLIQDEQPEAVAVEKLFFTTNAKTAIDVGQARGVIILTAKESGVEVTSYTPLQVKLSLTGYGKADKNQIQQMVKTILKLQGIPKPDDAADALAIALTHAFSRRLATQSRK